MKTLLNILIFVTISLKLTAQLDMATKNIFSRFKTDSITDVKLIFPGEVKVKETKGTQILIDIEVTTNMSTGITDAIFKRGRYTVLSNIDNTGQLVVELLIPKNDTIVIKGQVLEESFKTTVWIPEQSSNLRHIATK